MNYNAHLRARAGRSFGSADVFIAAGLAIAEFENENNSQTESDDFTLTGFSIGAGVDWPVTERLKARVEILHDDYGRKSTVQDNYSGDWTDTTLRGGLLFQF
ncbi:outer membrane protein [Taklimakanibacter lacteus]|uniref:outer membrane protein n=1 Tax=Taklimakanibacter lacteus TaxID=2268456 RepID=UPI000E66BA83